MRHLFRFIEVGARGLRYLKSMEFSLIRESLRERRVWEKIAPHSGLSAAVHGADHQRHGELDRGYGPRFTIGCRTTATGWTIQISI